MKPWTKAPGRWPVCLKSLFTLRGNTPMSFTKKALVTSLLCACALPALAYQTNDIIVRAGAIQVRPDVDAGCCSTLAGLDVDNDTQLGLTATWMLHPQIGVELVAATPFQSDITLGGAKVGSTKYLPPTLLLEWYPVGDRSQWIQPYVGVGVNYTFFFDERTRGGPLAPADLNLSSSVGVAVKVGVDANIGNNVLVNASVMKIKLSTDVDAAGGTIHQDDVDIDPYAVMIGLGMKF